VARWIAAQASRVDAIEAPRIEDLARGHVDGGNVSDSGDSRLSYSPLVTRGAPNPTGPRAPIASEESGRLWGERAVQASFPSGRSNGGGDSRWRRPDAVAGGLLS